MSLDVHLYGERIGTLFPAGDNDYRFAYDLDMIDRLGPGKGLLSHSLPVRPQPFSAEATRAYVEGLLPEGMRRHRIGRELGIDPRDGYLMLEELGRDCPGAVTFLPQGQPLEPRLPDEIAWLSEEELAELVRRPPPAYFSEERPQRMRATLPGVRHKLSLIRDEENDRWGWPEAGAPSTHVVKPETGEFPEYLANEMFCLEVARRVGLPVAEATVEEVGGRPCIVSRRYDRVVRGTGGGAGRLHAESFVQALGIPPGGEEGTPEGEAPDFAEVAGLLNAVGDRDELGNLVTAALCGYMFGDGDMHGRNFALVNSERISLDDDPGTPSRLAPIAHFASTAVYGDPVHTGMVLSRGYEQTTYLLELRRLAELCEVEFESLRELVAHVAAEVRRAIETVATRGALDGWYAPLVKQVVELTADRAFGLVAEVAY